MIDLLNEKYLTISEVAKLLPNKPHISTVHRYVNKGYKGCRLKAHRVGRAILVAISDLEAFINEMSSGCNDALPSCRQSSKQRNKQLSNAEAELRKFGVLGNSGPRGDDNTCD